MFCHINFIKSVAAAIKIFSYKNKSFFNCANGSVSPLLSCENWSYFWVIRAAATEDSRKKPAEVLMFPLAMKAVSSTFPWPFVKLWWWSQPTNWIDDLHRLRGLQARLRACDTSGRPCALVYTFPFPVLSRHNTQDGTDRMSSCILRFFVPTHHLFAFHEIYAFFKAAHDISAHFWRVF